MNLFVYIMTDVTCDTGINCGEISIINTHEYNINCYYYHYYYYQNIKEKAHLGHKYFKDVNDTPISTNSLEG